MTQLPPTYRRFAELNPAVSTAYESLGDACPQAGPLDSKTRPPTPRCLGRPPAAGGPALPPRGRIATDRGAPEARRLRLNPFRGHGTPPSRTGW